MLGNSHWNTLLNDLLQSLTVVLSFRIHLKMISSNIDFNWFSTKLTSKWIDLIKFLIKGRWRDVPWTNKRKKPAVTIDAVFSFTPERSWKGLSSNQKQCSKSKSIFIARDSLKILLRCLWIHWRLLEIDNSSNWFFYDSFSILSNFQKIVTWGS